MARKKPTMKSRAGKAGVRMTKGAKSVGRKVTKTGKNVGKAMGRGAKTAKTKAAAAFGSLKQKIKGKDEEE